MHTNVYSAEKKISTIRISDFQLCTDLSTISTTEKLKDKRLNLALLEVNCQNNEQDVDACSLNNYLPWEKRNGMGFVVYKNNISCKVFCFAGWCEDKNKT